MKFDRTIQLITFGLGLSHLLTALALLAAPRWFYENVGFHPPFNRHYLGDAGAFLLPLGIGLMAAARDVARHRLLVGVTMLSGVVHALNHAYDAWSEQAALVEWWADVGPIALQAALLVLVYATIRQRTRSHALQEQAPAT